MNKPSSIFIGVALILLGMLGLVMTVVASLLGFNPLGIIWQLWPAIVLLLGLCFIAPPFLVRGKPGMGALFIPGFPILTTGGILFLASVFHAWGIWSWLWPMLIISLGMGFLFAAIYMRVIWLVIPAVIIGLNGLVFQFCAITGLWHWWSVLWTVEPLAVGLALLIPGLLKHISGLTIAGLILCGIAGLMLMVMLTILGAWLPFGLLGPGLLILAGLGVLAVGMVRHLFVPRSALE
jgi:hypothetical protein